MKVCNICVIDKLETDFEKGNKQCKKCKFMSREYHKEYYENHKDKINERRREQFMNNKHKKERTL